MTTALTVLIWLLIGVIVISLVVYLFILYQINKAKKKTEKAFFDWAKKRSDLNHPANQELLKKLGDTLDVAKKNLENKK